MKFLLLFQLIVFMCAGTALAQSAAKIDLTQYLWKNRLILIFSPSEADSTYQDVKNQSEKLTDELVDRDLVLFHLFERGKSYIGDSPLDDGVADSLRQRYKIKPGELTLILIGKDGGEKLRQQRSFDFQIIFDRIDAMPMRQLEMKQREIKNG
jgi:hypothetical protein